MTVSHPLKFVAPLSIGLLVVGCSLPQPAATRYDASTARRPPLCTQAGKPIPLPASFPSQFPFPARTSITFTTMMAGGVTRIRGYIASRDFSGTVTFFEDYLPLSGFGVKPMRVESTGIVDESFWGHGHAGIWTVNVLPNPSCRGQLEISVESMPGNTPPADPG
jgi:hypothetical protein